MLTLVECCSGPPYIGSLIKYGDTSAVKFQDAGSLGGKALREQYFLLCRYETL
jgi:hypothetical protein